MLYNAAVIVVVADVDVEAAVDVSCLVRTVDAIAIAIVIDAMYRHAIDVATGFCQK